MTKNRIKTVTLTNIGPFAGFQTLEFKEGLNIVIGPGASGKTRLLRHIAAAWTGNLPVPEGMEQDYRFKVETECGDVEISDVGEGWRRRGTWNRPEGWDADAILLADSDSVERQIRDERDAMKSAAEAVMDALHCLCCREPAPDIILLDDVLARLDAKNKEEILGRLAKCGSQVILTVKRGMEFPEANIIRLERDRNGGTRVTT